MKIPTHRLEEWIEVLPNKSRSSRQGRGAKKGTDEVKSAREAYQHQARDHV